MIRVLTVLFILFYSFRCINVSIALAGADDSAEEMFMFEHSKIEVFGDFVVKRVGPNHYRFTAQKTAPTCGPAINRDSSERNAVIVALLFIVIAHVLGILFLLVNKKHDSDTPVETNEVPEDVPTVICHEPDSREIDPRKLEIIKKIGGGAFGFLHEGVLTDAQGVRHPCAVKTVKACTERDLRNEASVMKALNAHHVVKFLGVVSQRQPTLLVMELMGRGDLKSFLLSLSAHRKGEPLPLETTLRMAAEIADGMAYLAAKKIIHCDLAARNCMVTSDHVIKVGDFGMAKPMNEKNYYRRELTGRLPLRWMAPESLQTGVFSEKSDVWSFGVVLYEIETLGSLPYQDIPIDNLACHIIDGGVLQRPRNCREQLFQIMNDCWEGNPSNRPFFVDVLDILDEAVDSDFRAVSFFHSK